MKKIWHNEAWDDYIYWQSQDKKTLKKINALIESIERNGYDCIGKPEPLKGDYSGCWSAHIDVKNRLVFRLDDSKPETELEILQCRSHYSDK